MIWQQTLDELRAYIEQLEYALAETDSVLVQNISKIDQNPREGWPRHSVLEKALCRHELRQMKKRTVITPGHGK